MHHKNTKITVLMSVYNGEKYLRESLESILNQTYEYFEFIIIDDGSTDKSLEILESYDDKRIKIVRNKENVGLAKSLNKGLSLAKGEYIARMDADDIAISDRFEKQLSFMEKNIEVGICGTWMNLFGDKNEVWKSPSRHEEIFCASLFETMVYHPTVFMRKNTIDKFSQYYDESYRQAQDSEYWVRLLLRGVIFANIPKVLLYYRVHGKNFGKKDDRTKIAISNKIRTKLLEALGLEINAASLHRHNLLKNGKNLDWKDLETVEPWIEELFVANNRVGLFPELFFKKELGKRWFSVCYHSSSLGFKLIPMYRKNKFRKYYKPTFLKRIFFILKCLYRYEQK